ncbi:MAG: hypothetical protein JWM99_2150, partial [Verrucomicrobiales bacterium]|nr:hypothetical protein [Verrucomicrobiales bacterium]
REDLPNTAIQNTIESLAAELRTQTMLNAPGPRPLLQLETRFQSFNERFLNRIVDTAISQGKILPTEREHWRNQLEKDFDTKTAQLANAKPVLKTEFTRQFSNSSIAATSDSMERTRRIQSLVQDKMKNLGHDYDRARQEVKTENPALFASMQIPTLLLHLV